MAQTFNENIELQTLACLFKDGSLYPIVEDILERKAFGWKPFGIIFQSIKDIVDSDLYPDTETIATDLERKSLLQKITIMSNGLQGKDALNYIKKLDTNVDQFESYAYQVQELYANRQLLSLSEDMKKAVESGKRPIEILSDMDLKSGKIAVFVGAQSKNTRTSKDVAESNLQQLSDATEGKSIYISTGLSSWDDFTGGIAPRFYMIAAEQNEGKSSLVLNLIRNIAIHPPIRVMNFEKTKVKLFTFESSAEEIQNKLIQLETGISQIRIEKGNLSDEELLKYKDALMEIAESPILYDDSSELTLPLLRTKIRKACAEGAEIIFIDQLEQLFIGGSGDLQPEHIRLNYITYRIKAYQREQNIPIILVHQRKKTQEGYGKPQDNNLRDAELNDLNQAGGKAPDAVLMLRTKKEPAFFWVKNRQGKRGKVSVGWDGSRILFFDLDGNSEFPEFVQPTLLPEPQ